MVNIDNKYEVNEKVFVPVLGYYGDDCDLCNGTGKAKLNEYFVKCPKCHGKRNFNKKYTHIPKSGNVHLMKICYSKSETITEDILKIRYNVHFTDGTPVRERAEQNIFKTMEAYQVECDRLNKQTNK